MKILILDHCFASGKPLSQGDVVDATDNDAAVLRSMGLATADKDRVAAGELARTAKAAAPKAAAGKKGAETAAV